MALSIVRKYILFGGSFDPVHLGHLALAEYFMQHLHPRKLVFIPTAYSAQKPSLLCTTHRIAMLKLALKEWRSRLPLSEKKTYLHISHLEIQKLRLNAATSSYTINTLKNFRQRVGPRVGLYFLLGADQLMHLSNWYQWQQLCDYAHLCVAWREKSDWQKMSLIVQHFIAQHQADLTTIKTIPYGKIWIDKNFHYELCATQIRNARTGQQPQSDVLIERLLSTSVWNYIQCHHLYQS